MSSTRMMQHFATPGRLRALVDEEAGASGHGEIRVSCDWFGKRLLVESVYEERTTRDAVVRPQAMSRTCFFAQHMPP